MLEEYVAAVNRNAAEIQAIGNLAPAKDGLANAQGLKIGNSTINVGVTQGSIRYQHLIGIQQQGAEVAVGSAGIHLCIKIEIALARGLDETAITAQSAAAGRDVAVGSRRIVGPHDHRAAIADFRGIGFQARARPEESDDAVLNFRVLALVVSADLDVAASIATAGIDAGVVHHCDTIAEDFDAAAPGAGGDDASVAIDVCVLAGFEEDATAFIDDAAGIERAAVPDDHADDADASGFGSDRAEVGGIARGASDVNLDARRGAVDQADGGAGGKDGLAIGRGDDAFAADVAADQVNAAAGRRPDFALVDNVAGARRVFEQFASGKKVFVADVQGRSDKTGSIDAAAGTDHDAGRIDQPDTAIGT